MAKEHDAATRTLLSLRTRSGATLDRLQATEVPLQPLLELKVVRQNSRRGLAPEESLLGAIRQAASQLEPTSRLVVDSILALGLLARQLPGNDAASLYADVLAKRREELVSSWDALHHYVGVENPPPAPTVRTLRHSVEVKALRELAERLVATSSLDAVAVDSTDTEETQNSFAVGFADSGRPKVVVAGGAVTDCIFVVERIPGAGTAEQARSFESHPGGKGLNQAVAAARLGMDVQLVTAIGDDHEGRDLLKYLRDEGVNTDLVKVIPHARTPVTGIIVTNTGNAHTIGWKNDGEVRLDATDMQSRSVMHALRTADVVLLTFEPPPEVFERALVLASEGDTSPIVFLNPSPPYAPGVVSYDLLKHVDYLIGSNWELNALQPQDIGHTGGLELIESLATRLLLLGVGTVCIAEKFGCQVRSSIDGLSIDIPQFPSMLQEAAGARDAFSVALASRLVGRVDPVRDDLHWATAAMAAAQSVGGVASSMPYADQINHVLKSLNIDEHSGVDVPGRAGAKA